MKQGRKENIQRGELEKNLRRNQSKKMLSDMESEIMKIFSQRRYFLQIIFFYFKKHFGLMHYNIWLHFLLHFYNREGHYILTILEGFKCVCKRGYFFSDPNLNFHKHLTKSSPVNSV